MPNLNCLFALVKFRTSTWSLGSVPNFLWRPAPGKQSFRLGVGVWHFSLLMVAINRLEHFSNFMSSPYGDGSKPRYRAVNPKIAGKWMFIPVKMALIGIDPYPYFFIHDAAWWHKVSSQLSPSKGKLEWKLSRAWFHTFRHLYSGLRLHNRTVQGFQAHFSVEKKIFQDPIWESYPHLSWFFPGDFLHGLFFQSRIFDGTGASPAIILILVGDIAPCGCYALMWNINSTHVFSSKNWMQR